MKGALRVATALLIMAMIYILVGFVYVAGAVLAWKAAHRDMAGVYALNAGLHWALGGCHWLGLA